MKRFLDLTVSIFLIIIFFIPGLLIAILIKIDSPGPIFFISKRVGRKKKLFKMIKFRTMKLGTPYVHSNNLNNPHNFITNIGKFLRKYSIDELPQLINIFIGNMSLVGPRPALEIQKDLIFERDLHCINNLKPGLTGYAQVNGRDKINLDRKVELDNYYKKNCNILLDLKIIFQTILIIFNSKDINH